MMRNLKYTALLAAAALAAAALFAACSTDPTEEGATDPTGPTPLPQGDRPICWNVKEVASTSNVTRSLIGNDRETGDPAGSTDPNNPNYFLPLSDACHTDLATDPLKEKGFAVGLFGDYYYVENADTATPDTVRVYDLYRGTRLVYLPEVVVDDKVLSKWDTNVATKYWHPGAHYIFRAYYPQRLYNYTISNSNATTLALVYPSRKLQYDLLLGCAPVEATNEQMKKAVELEMDHALAALRFEFRLNFEDADILTSVYLHNDEQSRFFTQGTVTYGGKKDINSITWLQDYNPPASEVLYKWVPPLKYWYGKDKNGNGTIEMGEDKDGDGVIEPDETEELSPADMLKEWGWGSTSGGSSTLKPEDNPVFMSSKRVPRQTGGGTSGDGSTPVDEEYEIEYTQTSRAYYGMESHYDETPGSATARQWINYPKDEVAAEGTLYCRNSGWLLIPPQQSYGTLMLCFTTKRGEKAIYKVALPQSTGTLIDKQGRALRDKEGKLIKESTDGVDGWASGMRYTYLVTLSETNLGIGVTIEPWNERKHSTEIIF